MVVFRGMGKGVVFDIFSSWVRSEYLLIRFRMVSVSWIQAVLYCLCICKQRVRHLVRACQRLMCIHRFLLKCFQITLEVRRRAEDVRFRRR